MSFLNPKLTLSNQYVTIMCFSSPNGKKVVCGDWKRDTTDTNEQSLAISQIINHPSYNINTQANDISILKVTGSFTCSQGKVYPACLPSVNVSLLYTLISLHFPHDKPVLEIRIRGMGRHHNIWMGHHNIWRLHLQHTAICQSSSSF